MPHEFDDNIKQYLSGGRRVSRAALRAEIAKLTGMVAKDAAKIAAKYNAGRISLLEFEIAMRELLKSAHIVAASVGRGGWALMTQRDWGRVGAKLKWQYGFLAKFARKIGIGKIKQVASEYRARQYSTAIYTSFANSYQETVMEVATPQSGAEALLVQNSQEGCVECTADAAEGWMPVEDMGEIGSRICGDFCLCFIEFRSADGTIEPARDYSDVIRQAKIMLFGDEGEGGDLGIKVSIKK